MAFYASFLSANEASLMMVTALPSSYLARNGNSIFQLQYRVHVPRSCSCVQFVDDCFDHSHWCMLYWARCVAEQHFGMMQNCRCNGEMRVSNVKTNISNVNGGLMEKNKHASGWQMGRPLLFIHQTQRRLSLSRARTQTPAEWRTYIFIGKCALIT